MNAIIPIPRCEVSIRPAVAGDYAFVDPLQDMHSKALGFMPKKQLEGKIALGHVLIAEDETRLPIGYCMSQDRYYKRDELGIVFQMNISPGKQRHLVGATLLKAVFDRAAYGCKLFCCWCAQDLAANHFWEAMGFLPLAFRAGAQGKRIHIFWQKRIREGDTSTPYWFPAKTDGGMMREDRIILPIPPGVHWSDPMPILLPEVKKELPLSKEKSVSEEGTGLRPPQPKMRQPTTRRTQFGPPPLGDEPVVEKAMVGTKKVRAKKVKAKVDPVHLAKARELRDRYLEQFNSGLVLPGGKYEVSKAIENKAPTKMLAA